MAIKWECDKCKAIVDEHLWVECLELRIGVAATLFQTVSKIESEGHFDLCCKCAAAAFGDLGTLDMARGCGYERPIADRMLTRICETATGSDGDVCGRCGSATQMVVSYPGVTINGVKCGGFGKVPLCDRCTEERITDAPEQMLARLCGILG